MQKIYGNFSLTTGAHVAGICSLEIVPVEWIETFPRPGFITGIMNSPIVLKTGKTWLKLEFTPDSTSFTEKPKAIKGLPFYDVNISGLTNNLSAALRQQIETMRYHQVICKTTDTEGKQRITGLPENGMNATFDFIHTNKNDGVLEISVDLIGQQQELSPFYTG